MWNGDVHRVRTCTDAYLANVIISNSIRMQLNSIRMAASNIVQYVIVRGDLKWPTGALIAQGSHASVAAIARHITDQSTVDYLADLDHMTKIILKAESEDQLVRTSEELTRANIGHYAWREQPENVITALATAPMARDTLKPLLQEYKLFR